MIDKQAAAHLEADTGGALRRGGTRRAPKLVAGLVVGLAAPLLLLGAGGCKSEPEWIAPVVPVLVPARSLEYWVSLLKANARPWWSLQADCTVTIRNPRIPLPEDQAVFADGRLQLVKPGKLNLTAPASGRARIKLVSDGRSFRVEMPFFGDSYGGQYGGPPPPQPGRIHFLPADVVDGLEPEGLLAGRGQALIQWERHSVVFSMLPVWDPEPAFVSDNTIMIDRGLERVVSIEKYAPDGSVRVRIRYARVEAVADAEGQPVELPTLMRIEYPAQQTSIQILLRNVELNVEVAPETFQLAG